MHRTSDSLYPPKKGGKETLHMMIGLLFHLSSGSYNRAGRGI
jgi:hypothetical protein